MSRLPACMPHNGEGSRQQSVDQGWPKGEAMGGIGYESDCVQRKPEEEMEHGNAA
jgi:hypothetical protein